MGTELGGQRPASASAAGGPLSSSLGEAGRTKEADLDGDRPLTPESRRAPKGSGAVLEADLVPPTVGGGPPGDGLWIKRARGRYSSWPATPRDPMRRRQPTETSRKRVLMLVADPPEAELITSGTWIRWIRRGMCRPVWSVGV